jgi:type II secretory pathway component PulF
MLAAGVPITRSLQSVQTGGKFGRLFKHIATEVSSGQSLTDAAQIYRKQFSPLELTLIDVGEQTGQLAEMFESLSQWFAFRDRLARTARSGMLLPLIYIHATAFIVPVISCAMNEFDPLIYVQGVLGILGVFYIPAALIAGVFLLTPKSGPARQAMDRLLLGLPLIGSAIRELELSRFSNVFAITYKAGIPIVQCGQMAIDSMGNRLMVDKLKGGAEAAKAGQEMSTGFSGALPGEFLGLWRTGEETGDLDNAAKRLGHMHADNAEMKFSAIARWTPRLVYALVCMVMVYYILSGYSQLFGRAYSF